MPNDTPIVKVRVAGAANVGKSNFTAKLCFKVSDVSDAPRASLHLGDLTKQTVFFDGQPVKLEIWNPSLKNTPKLTHVKGCDVAVLMFDYTNLDSFNQLPEIKRQIAAQMAENCTYFVLGINEHSTHAKVDSATVRTMVDEQQLVSLQSYKTDLARERIIFQALSANDPSYGESFEDNFKVRMMRYIVTQELDADKQPSKSWVMFKRDPSRKQDTKDLLKDVNNACSSVQSLVDKIEDVVSHIIKARNKVKRDHELGIAGRIGLTHSRLADQLDIILNKFVQQGIITVDYLDAAEMKCATDKSKYGF